MSIPDAEIERARGRADVYGAATVLKRQGAWLVGRCPLHDDHNPSFGVKDGRWVCFSGCGHGDVIEFYRRWKHLDFLDAVAELLNMPRQASRSGDVPARRRKPEEDDAERTEAALRILSQCGPITDTSSAWLYLWSRGLDPHQPALFAHEGLWCAETKTVYPALVAPVTDSRDRITAIQRIWCLPRLEGEAKDNRAPVRSRKMALGPLFDGCVRLGEPSSTMPMMGLAEGIETALAASALFHMPVWATLGVQRLAAVWVPEWIEWLTIYADRGEVGEPAAERACEAHERRGVACSVATPADGFGDFNDEWSAKLAAKEARR